MSIALSGIPARNKHVYVYMYLCIEREWRVEAEKVGFLPCVLDGRPENAYCTGDVDTIMMTTRSSDTRFQTAGLERGYIYIYIYICMYVCMYVYIYIYILCYIMLCYIIL